MNAITRPIAPICALVGEGPSTAALVDLLLKHNLDIAFVVGGGPSVRQLCGSKQVPWNESIQVLRELPQIDYLFNFSTILDFQQTFPLTNIRHCLYFAKNYVPTVSHPTPSLFVYEYHHELKQLQIHLQHPLSENTSLENQVQHLFATTLDRIAQNAIEITSSENRYHLQQGLINWHQVQINAATFPHLNQCSMQEQGQKPTLRKLLTFTINSEKNLAQASPTQLTN